MSIGTGVPVTTDALLEEAIGLMRGARVAVLTGAGVSTDSGIPDYRGEGAPVRTPMTVQAFLASETSRKRYWAGSHLGWRSFGSARPNTGHLALAKLEAGGVVSGVITQNVDGLHRRAGSRHVVELHGSMDRVLCLTCGQHYARQAIADRLSELNPEIDLGTSIRLAPDGDVQVDDVEAMAIPACTVCGGVLKPDVVFFGENVPTPRVQRCFDAVDDLLGPDPDDPVGALLVVGSSLTVMSGLRFVRRAARAGTPVVIANRGTTRGDDLATYAVDIGCSEFLTALV